MWKMVSRKLNKRRRDEKNVCGFFLHTSRISDGKKLFDDIYKDDEQSMTITVWKRIEGTSILITDFDLLQIAPTVLNFTMIIIRAKVFEKYKTVNA